MVQRQRGRLTYSKIKVSGNQGKVLESKVRHRGTLQEAVAARESLGQVSARTIDPSSNASAVQVRTCPINAASTYSYLSQITPTHPPHHLSAPKMGNDGGSIPTRRELVKEAARNPTTTELKATQTESQSHNWSHDPLTRKPLQKPVVSDSNGKLYNKDSILEFLISGSVNNGVSAEEAEKVTLGAIKSLKDVVEVKFEIETEAKDGSAEVWKCPITAAKLGPGSKAVYLVPCGHAFSGIAIKEVLAAAAATASEEAEKCLECDEGFAPNDVIPILPIREEDIARLQIRSKRLREKGLTHSLKKAAKEKKDKKRKKGVVEETNTYGEEVPELVHVKGTSDPSSTPRTDTPDPTDKSKINNTSTASLTAKVMAEQAMRNKKRRLENDNLKTLFSSRDPSKPHGRSGDFMTRGFSIPADAKR